MLHLCMAGRTGLQSVQEDPSEKSERKIDMLYLIILIDKLRSDAFYTA